MHPEVIAIQQHAERAVPEEASAILSAGLIAHVGFIHNGAPQVIPMNYQYDNREPAKLYLHGAHKSRLLAALASGVQACINVTLVDGLVFSRTATYHSTNYRSVVCYGSAHPVEDRAVKAGIMESMIARYFPDRQPGKDYEVADATSLDATVVLEFCIERWSAKSRQGGPKGPHDNDDAAPGTSGVVEFPRYL